MRKLFSNYFLIMLVMAATLISLNIFYDLFMRSSSPVAVMVMDFAGGLL